LRPVGRAKEMEPNGLEKSATPRHEEAAGD